MTKPVHMLTVAQGLPPLLGRTPETEEGDDTFAVLAQTETGGIFTGTFQGDSAWERHPNGDELVQVLAGRTEITLLTEGGPETHDMTEGMMILVPRSTWHKFHAPESVTVMTMTPQPTEHSTADIPA